MGVRHRYLPNTDADRSQMLEALGLSSVEELFADIPSRVRFQGKLDLPPRMSELELVRHMDELAGRNGDASKYACFRGAGAYDHFIPSVVRHITGRAELYTAYTPYQPEVSQAVLQTIYEFQTMICELTGMEVANASMYDAATAVAEAAIISSYSLPGRRKVVVSSALHPEYRATLRTYARGPGLEVVEVPTEGGVTPASALARAVDAGTACVIAQQPNFFGCLEEMEALGEVAHAAGAHFAACVDPISLGILKPPGEYGADFAVGEGQSLGVPLGFGGPHLGFFAATGKLMRRMPGRIAGVTVDADGERGFVLTLQTREQHIRREKATSNICSNQALCALAATVYLSLMGKQGLREVAEQCVKKTRYAQEELEKAGYPRAFPAPFFREFAVRSPYPVERVNAALLKDKIVGGAELGRWYPELQDSLLIAVTEKRTRQEIDALVAGMGGSR